MERTRRRFLATLGSVLAVGSAGCSALTGQSTTTTSRTDAPTTPPETAEGDVPTEASDYTRVYRETIPSVVLVRVYTASGPAGQGSGWVYDDRHIITNEHVVDGASEVRVQFLEGEWRVADVVGTDVYSDLAVLRISDVPDYATPISLVDAEPPVGTRVVALGAPFDLGGSVSAGIVSGQNRTLPSASGFSIADAVQTDAAVNPGNSGGPLVTLAGDVAGVINSGGGDNIGFAISAALTRRVVPALVETGRYDHSYMGVQLQEVSPLVAEANDVERARGVIIVQVVEDGPAEGVLRGSDDRTVINETQVPVGGDIVVRMGDREIRTQADLSTFLALETSPGETIPVGVLREGSETTVQLTLGARPDP